MAVDGVDRSTRMRALLADGARRRRPSLERAQAGSAAGSAAAPPRSAASASCSSAASAGGAGRGCAVRAYRRAARGPETCSGDGAAPARRSARGEEGTRGAREAKQVAVAPRAQTGASKTAGFSDPESGTSKAVPFLLAGLLARSSCCWAWRSRRPAPSPRASRVRSTIGGRRSLCSECSGWWRPRASSCWRWFPRRDPMMRRVLILCLLAGFAPLWQPPVTRRP